MESSTQCSRKIRGNRRCSSCHRSQGVYLIRFLQGIYMYNITIYFDVISLREWVIVANSAIFQLYHGENKLISNEMMMMTALYYNTLSWIFIVLAHWNNSPRIDIFPHSETLSCPPVFALSPYCCVLSGETANTNFMVFDLTRSGLNRRSTALVASTLTITPLMQFYFIELLVRKFGSKVTNNF